MNSEKLREIYNSNFSQKKDIWSAHKQNQVNHIAKFIVKEISKINKKLKINSMLDVGCAKGHITNAFSVQQIESVGLDYSDLAIDQAKINFPNCEFIHMDGFNPTINRKFDLILIRGFSGCNTHSIDFVANFSIKYKELLTNKGILVIAFTSNYSGIEEKHETVNWTREEMTHLGKLLAMNEKSFKVFPNDVTHKLKKIILKRKDYFYLFYQKK